MSDFRNDTATLEAISNHKKRKERVVFTNGCFDILHVGHSRYLTEAKNLGDLLVVGINSDSSVSSLKGPERPVIPEDERKEMLLALRAVDYVFVFNEETPLELIHAVKPDVLVKGGDWPIDKIVGSDFVIKQGGDVKSLSFYEGHSSTNIIEKVKRL